jgi:hypothetical protein
MGRVVAKRGNCKLGFFSSSFLVLYRVVVVVCVLRVCVDVDVDVDVVSKATLGVLVVLVWLELLGVRCPSPRHATHTRTHCASSSLFFGSTPQHACKLCTRTEPSIEGKGTRRDEWEGKGSGAVE